VHCLKLFLDYLTLCEGLGLGLGLGLEKKVLFTSLDILHTSPDQIEDRLSHILINKTRITTEKSRIPWSVRGFVQFLASKHAFAPPDTNNGSSLTVVRRLAE